jgi:hypothetical protein
MKRGQFLLQGTALVDSVHIAFLKEVGSGTVHRVAKGEEIMGMKLAEVFAEKVVLKVGEDAESLPLIVAKTAGAPAATPAAASERGPFAGPETPAKAPETANAPATPAKPASVAAPAEPVEAAPASARRTPPTRVRPTPEEIAARRANRPTRTPRAPNAPASGAQPQN